MRTEDKEKGDKEAVAASSGVLEAAVIWYKKFLIVKFLNFCYFKNFYDDNQFVIATVKELRTGGSFRILLPFFLTSCGVSVLSSAIFNSFHNRVKFGTILEGLLNSVVGGRGVLNTAKLSSPLGTPLHKLMALLHFFISHQQRVYERRTHLFLVLPNGGVCS